MGADTVATDDPVRNDKTDLLSNEALNCNILSSIQARLGKLVASTYLSKVTRSPGQVQTHMQSTSAIMTEQIAHNMGKHLKGGEIIELVSDLGGGKTTFIRGLAKGMGSMDVVRSPSFTLANQYRAGQLMLYHFDFYRLNDPGIMLHELSEIMTNSNSVVAIEWSDIVQGLLTDPHIVVTLKATNEQGRDILIDYPKHFAYLFEETT